MGARIGLRLTTRLGTQLARLAHASQELLDALGQPSKEEVVAALNASVVTRSFRQDLQDFLDTHCRRLKSGWYPFTITQPSWREDPSIVISLLRGGSGGAFCPTPSVLPASVSGMREAPAAG